MFKHQYLRSLTEALEDAFPTYKDLEKMLMHQMNESLAKVAGEGSLSDVVFILTRWAKANGIYKILLIVLGRVARWRRSRKTKPPAVLGVPGIVQPVVIKASAASS